MVRRSYDLQDEEPNKSFPLPSEVVEHCFMVSDVFLTSDENVVRVKLEVCGGDEEGRSILNRLTLDENGKGFFATRIFLKAIGEPYKGKGVKLDTDNWIGRQFYATVLHNGKYANLDQVNFEKKVDSGIKGSDDDPFNPGPDAGARAWDDDK